MPRNIQTFLPDGTLEGVRIVELSESNVKAFVVPRIKLNDIKTRVEITQPALYFLIGSGESQLYIGESENFYNRVKNHDQSKDFWDVVIAVVSNTNILEKSDVKYLESLAIEKAKASAAMMVLNKTIPTRNNVHEFKVHTLEKFLDDTALIAELLGYSMFTTKQQQDQQDINDLWYAKSKLTDAKAQFRGSKFVVLAGSRIDKSHAPSLEKNMPRQIAERNDIFKNSSADRGDYVELTESVSFKSPNHAGHIVSGGSINAWDYWKNINGETMDKVIRKDNTFVPFGMPQNPNAYL